MTTNAPPAMLDWESAWASADADRLQSCYAAAGVVLPPSSPAIVGPAAIASFFAGGFDSIVVRFAPSSLLVADTLAYESGVVSDLARASGQVVEVCDYMVTWKLEGGSWKILLHTWSVPKGGAGHDL